MITRRGAKTGITSRGSVIYPFSLEAIPREVLVSSSSYSFITIDDAIIERYTSATVDNEADIVVVKHDSISNITLSSTNTNIATVNQEGVVSRNADGTIRIIGTNDDNGRIQKTDEITIARTGGSTTDQFDSWDTGTLAKACSDAVDDAIAGKNKTTHMNMYSSGNTRNSNCWAGIADLSCIDREKPNGVLISPQYGLQAAHYPDGTDRRVAMDGTVEDIAVSQARNISGTDIRVVKYSSPFSSSIVPALLPPSNLEDYFSQIQWGIPCLATDQEKKALVTDLYDISGTQARFKVPSDTQRLEFYESKIGGDSGSPAFLMIPEVNGIYTHRLVALTGWTYGGAGSGPDYNDFLTEINNAIDSMGGGPSDYPEIADLSSYATY